MNKIYRLNFFKILEWISYLGLFGTGIFFTWEAIEKFYRQDTGIKHYKEKFEFKLHPTITFCFKEFFWKFEDFNISYATIIDHMYNFGEQVNLNIGENDLVFAEGKINLRQIYTEHGLCYSLTTTNLIFEKDVIFIIDSEIYKIPNLKLYFTCEKDLYGISRKSWKDIRIQTVKTTNGKLKIVDLMHCENTTSP